MNRRKLYHKNRGKYGHGRKEKTKHLVVSEQIKNDLNLLKQAYSICLSQDTDDNGDKIPVAVSFDQMFRRWIDHIGRIDADVKQKYDELKLGVWNQRFFFQKEGENDREAHLGNISPFYATINGRVIGMKGMLDNGWTLINEHGDTIELAAATELHKQFIEYKQKLLSQSKTGDKDYLKNNVNDDRSVI